MLLFGRTRCLPNRPSAAFGLQQTINSDSLQAQDLESLCSIYLSQQYSNIVGQRGRKCYGPGALAESRGAFPRGSGARAGSAQAFLDEACGGDADLRRQVELLLAKAEEAGSFLETPAMRDITVTQTAAVALLGRQFGPYRILSPLGAGGMGEVYRAHDSKLGRDVAIKTLPPEFARDPERLARFRREARTLASLNHPNIAAIYGLEESGEVDCLVLELVEGETLRGPLPVEPPRSITRARSPKRWKRRTRKASFTAT